jgi:hypothetical protein
VSELRGFDGNSLLLNTFADGSGLIIEEGGEIQAEKPLNLLSNAISGVSSITIDGNAKNTIIDNDFNTFDAGSVNSFNVDLGGTHDFTINNQQKFTVTNNQLEVRTKLNMFGTNQIQCTNFTTDISSNLNFLIDGETLNFRRFGAGLDIGWSDGDIVFDTNNLNMDNNTIKNLTIEEKVVYVPDGSFPTSFTSGYTYILIGTRTITTQVNLTGFDNITFKGLSRETSEIVINVPASSGFLTTNANISFTDLKIRNTTNDTILIDATDLSKTKILSITNCEFRNCRNGFDIEGYELVDFLNNIFIHFQGGSTIGSVGLKFTSVAKLQITSCEVVKWFEEGQPANTNPFAGNMIEIYGSNGATNISSGVIHPRVAQNGVYLDASATWLEICINGNAFIDIGLTTGKVFETNSNTSYETVGVTESNSLIPNLKSRLGAQLSAINTNDTATSATPADINVGSLLTAFDEFGVTTAATGGVTYNRKRPVNFQVTFVANLQAITGGANQRVGLTVSKNGVNIPVYSFVTLDSAGTNPQSCTLTIVGSAVQGDVFRSQLVNFSTSSDIRCVDLLLSGIEI